MTAPASLAATAGLSVAVLLHAPHRRRRLASYPRMLTA
jgi:hypothetical protein